MTICSQLCELIKSELVKSPKFNNIDIVMAYESDIKPVPLEKIIVALSVKKCALGDNIIEVAEDGEETVTSNRNVTSTVSANIYIPYSYKAQNGPQVFESIIDVLMASHNRDILSANCYDTNYVRSAQALVTKSDIVFKIVGDYES